MGLFVFCLFVFFYQQRHVISRLSYGALSFMNHLCDASWDRNTDSWWERQRWQVVCLVSVNSPVKFLFYSRIHSRYNTYNGGPWTWDNFFFSSSFKRSLWKHWIILHWSPNLKKIITMTHLFSSRNVSEVAAPGTGSADQTGSFHQNKTLCKRKDKEDRGQTTGDKTGKLPSFWVQRMLAIVNRSISQIHPQKKAVPNLPSYSSR